MIYAKLGAILVLVSGLLALGYHFGEMPYKTKYEALQAQDWQSQANAQEAAKTVIAAQLVQAQATSANNAQSLVNLANENAQITADRDANLALARRLLSGQARSCPAGGAVSKAPDHPAAAPAGGPQSPTRAESLLVAAADESERCANQLNALIAQIRPQL